MYRRPIYRKMISAKIRAQERKLDEHVRGIVFERDGFRCVLCGSTKALQWSHLISRRRTAVRWDPLNSTCMCARCHYKHHKYGPEAYILWFIHTYGQSEYEDLVRRSNIPLKRTAIINEKLEEYGLD